MPDRSPFPGMDPWLERYWNDVHHTYINDLADQLASTLPGGLYVGVEEDVYVVDPDEPPSRRRRQFRPDVTVIGDATSSVQRGGDGDTAVAEPIRILLPVDPVTLGHIEIRDLRDGHPLVTAIEVLSPTNKAHPQGRDEYARKRQAYYDAGANVVEIDLLRAGRHLVDVPMGSLAGDDLTSYRCVIRRGGQTADVEVEYYPVPLRSRLPRLRVPLRPGDAGAVVDLQPPVDHVYARGRYATRLDYARPPDPPLSPDDAAWAAECVAAGRPV